MHSSNISNNNGLGMFGLVAGALLVFASGCATDSSNEDIGVATMAILGESSDNADEPELGRLRGMGLGLIDGMPGVARKCDAEPKVTLATVCGVELATAESYAWADCKMSMGGQGKGKGRGGPVSSGTIEVSHDIAGISKDCDETTALKFTDTTDINVERLMPNGRQMTLTGTMSATSKHGAEATEFSKQVEVSVQREVSDVTGTLLRQIEVNGTATVAFSLVTEGPKRVIDGTLTADLGDGETHEVTLVGVTRRDVSECRWPVAGTLTRVESDGTSHELVFSSSCGQATLDGVSIDLNAQRGNGGHGKKGNGSGSGNCVN